MAAATLNSIRLAEMLMFNLAFFVPRMVEAKPPAGYELEWPDEFEGTELETQKRFQEPLIPGLRGHPTCYHTSGTGHLYQGRFKAFPVETDEYFYTVARYVERNALRAELVTRAQAWRCSSLWRRESGTAKSAPCSRLGRFHARAIGCRA